MATVKIENFELVERQLMQLPIEMRGKVLRAALRKAGKLVVDRAKQLVPPPGYPGDKPEYKPLRDSLAVETRGYTNALVAIVGAKRPAGTHGHLVEESHRHFSHGVPTGVMTEPTPFIGPAAEQTAGQQQITLIDGIKKAVAKATQ